MARCDGITKFNARLKQGVLKGALIADLDTRNVEDTLRSPQTEGFKIEATQVSLVSAGTTGTRPQPTCKTP